MMKTDHNNHFDDKNFDDFLTKQLQQTQAYVQDDNFTAKVMSKLPTAKKLSVWQERLIIAVPLLIISVLVLSQFYVLAILIKLWTLLAMVNLASLLKIGLFTSIVVISSASYWFAKQFKLM